MIGPILAGWYSPSGVRIILDTHFTAGSALGYDGYVRATCGAIDDGVITGVGEVGQLADQPADTEFAVSIVCDVDSDPGESFISDVLLDDVSIWGDFVSYSYTPVLKFAIWYFAPQGIVDTTEYHIQLVG